MTVQSFLGENGITWSGYLELCVLAVMTAIMIHIVLHLIGRTLKFKELENYATSEMLQAAATAFMVIFLVVMLESALTLGSGIIRGQLTCGGKVMTIAQQSEQNLGKNFSGGMNDVYEAIKCRINERALRVAQVQDQNVEDAVADNMLLNLQLSTFGIAVLKGEWISDWYKRAEKERITNNLATVMLIGMNAHYTLAEYMRINMMHVFLPVGLLLRSFYFTRGPGALMMALGIGMYFIFPIFYVLLDPGFVSIPAPPTSKVSTPKFCYATMSSTTSLIMTAQSKGVSTTSSLGFVDVKNELSKSYISLMTHPLVALFLTLVFVRYLMTVLGGDTYELTKMVAKVV